MPRIRLKFNATACADPLATISSEFPDDEFTVLAAHLTDDGIVGLVDIETPNATAVIRHFDSAPAMHSYDVVSRDEQTALVQYMYPEPDSYRALRASGNLPRFPALLQEDGYPPN